MPQDHSAWVRRRRPLPTANLWIYLVNKWAAFAPLRGASEWGFPDMIGQQDPESPTPGGGSSAGSGVKRIKVSELLKGEREVILEHDAQDYRLRITANGKLILTK
jgi:hemin uptake protein HemP